MKTSILLVGWLVSALWCAACRPQTSTQSPGLIVDSRSGTVIRDSLGAEHAFKRIKQGTSTRKAVEVLTDSAFDVEAGSSAERMAFSVGFTCEPPNTGEGSVTVGGEGGSSVYSEKLTANSGWRDVTIEIPPALRSPARLKIEVTIPRGSSCKALLGGFVFFRAPTLVDRWFRGETPNVILISLDTVAATRLGAYSARDFMTPNIDAFLRDSLWFRRAYATYGNTLVSHASLFTGMYPASHGMYPETAQLAHTTLADVLADRGYFTAAFTEDAMVGSVYGFDRGFDFYDDGESTSEVVTGNATGTFGKALEWLKETAEDSPFFLFVHTYQAHSPYKTPDDESRAVAARVNPHPKGRFVHGENPDVPILAHNIGINLLGQEDFDQLAATYDGGLNYLDRLFGRFIADLGALPRSAETIVVLLSDHGEEFGEHGTLTHSLSLYDPVMHVPLAFHWTGKIAPAARDDVVQLTDVMPTLMDLVGLSTSGWMDGRSLVPAFAGRTLLPREAFSELSSSPVLPVGDETLTQSCQRYGLAPDCRFMGVSIVEGDYKLISQTSKQRTELYDLVRDPGETRNLAAEAGDVVLRLAPKLYSYEVRVSARQAANQVLLSVPKPDEETIERLKALGYMQK